MGMFPRFAGVQILIVDSCISTASEVWILPSLLQGKYLLVPATVVHNGPSLPSHGRPLHPDAFNP